MYNCVSSSSLTGGEVLLDCDSRSPSCGEVLLDSDLRSSSCVEEALLLLC